HVLLPRPDYAEHDHALPDLDARHARAERLDRARPLVPADGRELWQVAVMAEDGVEVGGVERAVGEADAYLARSRLRRRELGEAEHVGGLAEGVEAESAHCVWRCRGRKTIEPRTRPNVRTPERPHGLPSVHAEDLVRLDRDAPAGAGERGLDGEAGGVVAARAVLGLEPQ